MGIVERFDEHRLDARCCAVLGIDRTASLNEIKTAYRRLAYRHHPDRNPQNQEADNQLKAINAAYETLCSAMLNKRSGPKTAAHKQVSADREPIAPNAVYDTFVEALLGESNRRSGSR